LHQINIAGDGLQNQLNCGEIQTTIKLPNPGLDKPEGEEAGKMTTEYKSRTQKKNEDRALQSLGEQLVALPLGQLENVELPDELLTAIELARKIKSRSARRRQIQYIGVLMRHIDPQPIEAALKRIRSGNMQK